MTIETLKFIGENCEIKNKIMELYLKVEDLFFDYSGSEVSQENIAQCKSDIDEMELLDSEELKARISDHFMPIIRIMENAIDLRDYRRDNHIYNEFELANH